MVYKIFIVEDDTIISESMKIHLEKWGYEVETVSDFNNITQQFAKANAHLVLMDISLPYYNGHYWCSEIRKISKVPIIFVSSSADSMNIVMAVNMGGDDFISKPFDLQVLSAKIQAVLRRTYSFQPQNTLFEHKGVILDIHTATISYNSQKIELTKNDFKIMQILFENIGKVVSRENIMKRLWENDCFIDDNTLTVNMTRLRKKLDEYGIVEFIATKKGMGYTINE